MAVYLSPDYQTSSESTGLSVQEKFNIDFPAFNQNDFNYFWLTGHLDTSNEVSSPLAFWFRIKKGSKQIFNIAARATILDFLSEWF